MPSTCRDAAWALVRGHARGSVAAAGHGLQRSKGDWVTTRSREAETHPHSVFVDSEPGAGWQCENCQGGRFLKSGRHRNQASVGRRHEKVHEAHGFQAVQRPSQRCLEDGCGCDVAVHMLATAYSAMQEQLCGDGTGLPRKGALIRNSLEDLFEAVLFLVPCEAS